ncbi:MAG TPA: PQQ-like beta-propeller repeat protein [bacterium]|nr:PQQ-like beta-propeller repeat protein [bacterium]HPN43512.1 PQQ-like beta-propeller repeat protein [bacterium]
MQKRTLLLTPVILFLSFIVLNAADWPCWRGPHGNGITDESNWNPKALLNPEILWRKNIGKGHGAAIIKANHCYVTGWESIKNGDKDVEQDNIFCLNTLTGKEVWRFTYPQKKIDWAGPRSTPVLDGDRLYSLSWQGDLYCLNAATGKVVWHRNLLADSLAEGNKDNGFCNSPAIEGELLLLPAGNSGMALNKKTGELVWNSGLFEECMVPTPVVFNYLGKRTAAMITQNGLCLVEALTGKLVYGYQDYSLMGDPVIIGSQIYLSERMLNITDNKAVSLWENDLYNSPFQTGVVVDNYAYQYGWKGDQPMALHCIDIKTGQATWHQPMGELGSLISANNKLIIIDGQGKLVIAECNPTHYTEISSAHIFTNLEKSKCYCLTAPTLANSKIYIRSTDGDLACVDVSF